jgi:hypothetical protein
VEGMILEYTSSRGIHNTGISNVSGILEFCFFSFVISVNIANPKFRRVIFMVTSVFALLAFSNLLFVQKEDGINPINFTIGSLITVIFCIYYFVELFRKAESPSLAKLPDFWIVSGILFNVVLTFPMFALISFMDQLTKKNLATSKIIFDNINVIFDIIIVFTYILYSIGFLCRIRTKKSIS